MTPRTLVLIGIAAILAILVAVFRFGGNANDVVGAVRRDPPTQSIEIVSETGPFLPPVRAFEAISERPLFRPDRRPAPITVETPPPQTTAPPAQIGEPDFIVVGTASGPEGWAATIRSAEETERVYVGDTFEGWRIEDISGSRIRVSQAGEVWNVPVGERD